MWLRLFILSLGISAHAQINDVIPAYRRTDWSLVDYVGCRIGPFTNRAVYTTISVTEGTDIAVALQAAIDSCPSNEVVRIPAGEYFVDNFIYVPPYITIQGAGMVGAGRTHLNFRLGGFQKANDNSSHLIHQGYRFTLPLAAGTTNLTIADGSAFTIGKLALLARYNSTDETESNLVAAISGQSTTNSPNGFTYKTTRRIDNIAGNVITFWPPLEKQWTNDAVLFPMNLVSKYIGFEDFCMTASNVTFGIQLGGVIDCWMKRIRTLEAKNRSIGVADSIGVEITDCWFDDGKITGSNGAHLLVDTCTSTLIENNIVMNCFPGIEVNFGSVRVVVGYNYLFNTNGLAEIYSNHGPHNTFNLYEGNICNHILSDGYFGGESDHIMFRNWLLCLQPASSELVYAFGFKRFSRNINIVGNIFGLGSPFTTTFNGYSFGGVGAGVGTEPPAPPWADWPTGGGTEVVYQERDWMVTNTAIVKLNYNFHDDAIPSEPFVETSGATLPASLYRTSKPWFFPISWTYPPINSASVNTSFNPSNTWILPAQYAYFNGGVWPALGDAPVAPVPAAIGLMGVNLRAR